MFFKQMNTEDLQAAITGLYAFRSMSFDLAMKELSRRLNAEDFAKFCKDHAFA